MRLKTLTLAGMFAAATLIPGLASAGDPAAGKAASSVCASCHGQNGISQAEIYPNLAGQKEGYLVSALTAYKNQQRGGGMSALMTPQAAGLSKEDIENLAAYYASLPAGGN